MKIKISHISKLQLLVQRFYNRIVWVINIFKEKNISYSASALSYSLFFSIVPLMALVFAVARGFGLDDFIMRRISTFFASQPEVVDMLLQFTDKYLIHAKSGIFIGSGILLLLFTFSKLLYNIEDIFNQIWNVRQPRSLRRKVMNYMCAVVYLPVFFILSSGISVYFSKTFDAASVPFLHAIPFSHCIPYVLMISFLCFIYMIIPNTKVSFKNTLLTAIPIGIVLQLLIYGYINTQVFTTSYNAIYGSFAAIPIAMFWVQIVWYLILFGATWIYVLSNEDELESPWNNVSRMEYHYDMICLLHVITINFYMHQSGTSIKECRNAMLARRALTERFILDLEEVGLVHQSDDKYYPSVDTEQLTVGFYFQRITTCHSSFMCDEDFRKFIVSVLQLPYAETPIIKLQLLCPTI